MKLLDLKSKISNIIGFILFSFLSRLAGEFLKTDYLFVVVGRVGGACRDVQQNILQVSEYSKRDKLLDILQSIGNFPYC